MFKFIKELRTYQRIHIVVVDLVVVQMVEQVHLDKLDLFLDMVVDYRASKNKQ
jgi:hypothetical protein